MLKGIGIDIVENRRFASRDEKFLRKIFTEGEICNAPSVRSEEYYASRFAAKEAFSKALGTGFHGICARDIEIRTDGCGAPYIVNNPKIGSIIGSSSVFLSISHEKEYSVAMVAIDG